MGYRFCLACRTVSYSEGECLTCGEGAIDVSDDQARKAVLNELVRESYQRGPNPMAGGGKWFVCPR